MTSTLISLNSLAFIDEQAPLISGIPNLRSPAREPTRGRFPTVIPTPRVRSPPINTVQSPNARVGISAWLTISAEEKRTRKHIIKIWFEETFKK
jgi:hypothetical protein